MICPVCKKEGKKSRITIGESSCTLMNPMSYYDEDGRFHSHDPNAVTTNHSCSNGHKFQYGFFKSCPNCAFGDEEVVTLINV